MRIIDFTNYMAEMPILIKNHNETVLIKSDVPCILYGVDKFNNPYNFSTYHTHTFGGVIVNFEGDVCVVHCEINGYTFGEELMNSLVNWLTAKGLECVRDNNDVLVDGYKVASYMSTTINGVVYSAAHISVCVDLTTVQKICTKPMNKIPKGLFEYGITQKDVIAYINNVYNNK